MPRMLQAIELATRTVCLEMYIFEPEGPGQDFLVALVDAAQRGVRVQVLLDALGSPGATPDFWHALRAAGGEVRHFHPGMSRRMLVRDHRKVLVCDDRIAFVVGFNIAPEYDGDGVESGWRDGGLELAGPVVASLAALFDEQWENALAPSPRLVRFRRRSPANVRTFGEHLQILPVVPGRGESCLTRALFQDLATAREVVLVTPYFLPPTKLRRAIRRVRRKGGRVQIILPAQSDVPLARLAARRLYAGLLRARLEIAEYQPRILHAKILLIDDVVYVGSSNLDQRSLHLNYELMLRVTQPDLVRRVRAEVQDLLAHSRAVDRRAWAASRSWWDRAREFFAFSLLYRIDPWVTLRAMDQAG